MTISTFSSRLRAAAAGEVALFIVALAFAVPAQAQQGGDPVADSTRSAQAQRADLDSMARAAELVARNAGSDAALRTRKLAEAEAIRTRLRDGDFSVGDRIF